jgi:hypothetical protein
MALKELGQTPRLPTLAPRRVLAWAANQAAEQLDRLGLVDCRESAPLDRGDWLGWLRIAHGKFWWPTTVGAAARQSKHKPQELCRS